MDFSSKIKTTLIMNKILWVDDDIHSVGLRAYVDEFSDEGIEIVKINNSDDFQNALDTVTFDCLIMDMMMPTGENLSLQETKGGLHTGLRLLEKYLEKGISKPIIIFTVLNDEIAREWAMKYEIPYRLKQNEVPDTFLNYIKLIIGQSDS